MCGGIGIRNAIDGSLDKSTGYSASVSTSFGSYNAEAGYQPAELGEFGAFAERQGYDMAAGLRASVAAVGAGDFDAAASRTAQIDFLVDPADGLVMDDVERASGLKLSDYAGASVNSGYGAYPVYLAKLSQVNAALELAGRPALELGAGECAVFSDSDITSGFYRDAVDRGTVLSVGGRDLRVAEFRGESLQTTPFPMNTGTLVVPDEAVPAGSAILQSVLDVQCASDEDEAAFGEMMDAVADADDPDTWPITCLLYTSPSPRD